jgi:potassium/hydrogen antiporter
MNVIMSFLFISGIFLFGFFSNIFFRKTKISNIFFLLLIGYILGPLFNIIPLEKVVVLNTFTPFFGAMALMILLFEGGMHLNFYKVIKEFGRSVSFTFLTFFITMTLVGILLHLAFGYTLLVGLLIGAIIGGVSSAVTVPLLQKSKAGENTKTILTLESAINDALCVIIAIGIIEIIIAGSVSFKVIMQSIVSAFAIGTVIGVVGGLFWLKMLRDFSYAREFSYLLTISFLFFLYSITEYFYGNGAFCALIFGLVLGNGLEILKIFKMKEFKLERSMLRFQHEISLFIRTFFFVYLGLIVNLSNLSLNIILIVVLLLILILLSRMISIRLMFSKQQNINKDSRIILSLHARGLAAAVLATYPLSLGLINIDTILPIVFLIILLTNFTTTIYFFLAEKKKKTIEEINTESH